MPKASKKPTKSSGRPRVADDERKDELVRVRVTAEQRALFAAAAAKAGLDVSSWLRALGIREAQKADGGP